VEKANVYLSLGTNLGERAANLQAAINALPPAVNVLRMSRIYETAPWGYLDQPDFLNQVLEAQTSLKPLALLHYIKEIEKRLGRKDTIRYGPRLIDLDILFYDDLVLELPDYSIPHARLAERAFVLTPLAGLIPDFRHPVSGQTVSEMLRAVDGEGVRLYSG